jgi:hypothetical protein
MGDSDGPSKAELRAIRLVLDEAGERDVAVEFSGRNGFLRRRSGKSFQNLGALYKHDRSWSVFLGQRSAGRSGYRGGLSGEDGVPVEEVLRRAIVKVTRPFGPALTLEEELPIVVARALDALDAERGGADHLVQVETDAGGARFVWTGLFACETKKELRAAFEIIASALAERAGAGATETSHRKLRARAWRFGEGTLAAWETDHDPGHGLQVHVGLWKESARAAVPPW